MIQINPKKLLNSKWTAVHPERLEKHFIITKVEFDEDGKVERCVIEAIMTNRSKDIDWRELKDSAQWTQGWK